MSATGSENEQKAVFVVRFAHIDGAAVVFYPRYVEMLGAVFPRLPLARPPFRLAFEFRKPNRLGDELELHCTAAGGAGPRAAAGGEPGGPAREADARIPADGASSWTVSGRLNGNEHFSAELSLCAAGDRAARSTGYRPMPGDFRARPVEVGEWAAGSDARLHLSRYLEYLNAAIEQWFEDALGLPFRRLHSIDGNGVPTVRLELDCRTLPRVGEEVAICLRPARVGKRSFTVRSGLMRGDQCLVASEQVMVFIERGEHGMRSAALPAAVGRRMRDALAAPEMTA